MKMSEVVEAARARWNVQRPSFNAEVANLVQGGSNLQLVSIAAYITARVALDRYAEQAGPILTHPENAKAINKIVDTLRTKAFPASAEPTQASASA